MTVIIDYQTGNIGSIKNMLARIGHPSRISNVPAEILASSRIILPGVGSFDYGMERLRKFGLIDAINVKVLSDRIPVLGICLGAQLMCQRSEEGAMAGLAWIDGEVKKFPTQWEGKKNIVPHMGWEHVTPLRPARLFMGLEHPRFYFAQSYYIQCRQNEQVITRNVHGVTFDSSFEKENIVGVQFHPEKSHVFGSQLLRNFIENY